MMFSYGWDGGALSSVQPGRTPLRRRAEGKTQQRGKRCGRRVAWRGEDVHTDGTPSHNADGEKTKAITQTDGTFCHSVRFSNNTS